MVQILSVSRKYSFGETLAPGSCGGSPLPSPLIIVFLS